MTAEVLEGNQPALALYKKAGFAAVGRAQGHMPGNERFAASITELMHPGWA
jgi:RimJ/RimL family protein N-acetyltransferase